MAIASTAKTLDVPALQAAVRDAGIDGWLFYDFRRTNPVAHRILGISPHSFFSRRFCYYVPAQGEPSKLVSAVEAHVLDSLPGTKYVYSSWQQYREHLKTMLGAAKRVAMEYVPHNDNPYVSYVDAGMVELIRELGYEVVSSADFAQRFEAVLTPEQIESHRKAGQALLRARDRILPWVREQVTANAPISEYDVQREFGRLMQEEGLEVSSDEKPLVAVNGNAGNPHYAPTAERHTPVRKGDLLLLDFSAPLAGQGNIFADYTWMAYLGEQVPERIATLFGIIRDARDAGIALLRQRFESGQRIEGREVDDAVRKVITDAGYGPAFVHRTGHNISTMVHGWGAHLDNLETRDTRPLLPNTITSMEPGIYLPDQGIGVRTEVDVILLPGGIEVTGTPAQTEVTPLLA